MIASWLVAAAGSATLEVPGDHPDVATAVAAAQSGDRILVAAGRYDGQVVVHRDVTLEAAGEVVLAAPGAPTGAAVIDVVGARASILGFGVDGAGVHRALRLTVGADVDVAGLTLVNPATGDGDGGAIAVLDGSELELRDAELVAPPVGFARGGYVFVSGGRLSVLGGRFVGGRADDGDGGAVFGLASSVRIEGATFEDTTSSEAGGAVAVIGGGAPVVDELVVIGSTFTRSRAGTNGDPTTSFGGAVFAWGVDTFEVEGSTFVGCSAGTGGAVASTEVDGARIEGSRFEGNAADGGGGAVAFAFGRAPRLTRSTLIGNTAGGSGGAVLAAGSQELVVAGAAFCENQAPEGAAIALTGAGGAAIGNSAVVAGATDAGPLISADLGGGGVLSHLDLLDGGAPVLLDPGEGTLELRDSVVVGAGATLSTGTGALATDHDVFWEVEGVPNGASVADPLLARSAGACTGDLRPPVGSPLVDAASDLDPDGSPGDVGALGGPDAGLLDVDLDGAPAVADCDDADPSVGADCGTTPEHTGTPPTDGAPAPTADTGTTAAPPPPTDEGKDGCGCASGGTAGGALLLGALAIFYPRTRRARARISSVAP